MRAAHPTSARRAASLEETALHEALWIAIVVVVASVVVLLGAYVLAAAAVAGAAAFLVKAYVDDESRREFAAPLDAVWRACVGAMADNGFSFQDPAWRSATVGRIHGRDATIVVERLPGERVRVRARVGLFATPGNLRRAALLMESVAKGVA